MTTTHLLRRSTSAALVVFLHYVPQVTRCLEEDERCFGRWGLGNVLRIGAGVLLLTAAALAMDAVLRRWAPRWAERLYHHLFLAALLSGVLAAFPAYTQGRATVVAAIWWTGLAAIGGSFAWQRSPAVRYAATLCLVFSPLVPIMFVEMLLWPRWDERLDPLPAVQAVAEPGPPVLIFIFDEWSWPRSRDCDGFAAEFPNLRDLSGNATVYLHAVSPFRETVQSLARSLYQTDARFVVRRGRTWLESDGASTPTREAQSIFLAARERSYRTYLLGFHHAYRRMLGDQVDVCRSYFPGDEAGPPERLFRELLENTRDWPDPLCRKFGPALSDQLDVKNWRAMAHRCRGDMFRVLAECPRRSLAVFHLPVPHAPFVFNADGSDRAADASTDDVEGYRRQLGCVDTLVGQIVAELRRTGRYDESLLILTSDHGWRAEPDPDYRRGDDWECRVPLVVKRPGQKTAEVITQRFCTNRLMPLIEPVLRSEAGVGRPGQGSANR